jgi:pyridoxal phosphate enzyme (YggS family)
MIFAIILKTDILESMGINIAENIEAIKAKIAKTQPKAQLIAVSKNHGEEKIRQAIASGQKLFGENRVQEAMAKFPQLKKKFPEIRLHLIGPLQTNKVKDALALFDVIQTVDREKLAVAIAKEADGWTVGSWQKNPSTANRQPPTQEFFIQVNIGEEEQKAGIAPKATEEFYKFCAGDLKLNITGLMCIPPLNEPAFMYFALLKNIANKLDSWTVGQLNNLPNRPTGQPLRLSMGMSADYEDALSLSADYIRLGTAIFGER